MHATVKPLPWYAGRKAPEVQLARADILAGRVATLL